ncbi:MAG: hypothetical protein CMJ64_03745 [Planctomycetaceae bacterium]|nr:hypothetical protein [Planctomycetaceae bacterium]
MKPNHHWPATIEQSSQLLIDARPILASLQVTRTPGSGTVCRHDDDSGRVGQLRPTAAIMAGVTNRLWTFEDLFNEAM